MSNNDREVDFKLKSISSTDETKEVASEMYGTYPWNNSCSVDGYEEFTEGKGDIAELENVERKYNTAQKEIDEIASSGFNNQAVQSGGKNVVEIATSVLFLTFGTALTATGAGGPFGMLLAGAGAKQLGYNFWN